MAAVVKEGTCTGCGACVNACPVGAIKIENNKAMIGNDCFECGACVMMCPMKAISI